MHRWCCCLQVCMPSRSYRYSLWDWHRWLWGKSPNWTIVRCFFCFIFPTEWDLSSSQWWILRLQCSGMWNHNHLHCRSVFWRWKQPRFSKIFVHIYWSMLWHIPEDWCHNIHHCENSDILLLVLVLTPVENSAGNLIICCISSYTSPAFSHIPVHSFMLLYDTSWLMFNAISH